MDKQRVINYDKKQFPITQEWLDEYGSRKPSFQIYFDRVEGLLDGEDYTAAQLGEIFQIVLLYADDQRRILYPQIKQSADPLVRVTARNICAGLDMSFAQWVSKIHGNSDGGKNKRKKEVNSSQPKLTTDDQSQPKYKDTHTDTHTDTPKGKENDTPKEKENVTPIRTPNVNPKPTLNAASQLADLKNQILDYCHALKVSDPEKYRNLNGDVFFANHQLELLNDWDGWRDAILNMDAG